jgi:S-adenosylmethionine synthetase
MAMNCFREWVDEQTDFLFNPTGEWQSVNSCSAADSGVTEENSLFSFMAVIPEPNWAEGLLSTRRRKRSIVPRTGTPLRSKEYRCRGISRQVFHSTVLRHRYRTSDLNLCAYLRTGVISDNKIGTIVREYFDLSPRGMIERFNLLDGEKYRKLPKTLFLDDYPWEKTDMVDSLKKAADI